jgi:chromosomal replication initiator protein
MRLLSLGPERAELTVPNNFLREWIYRKYFGVLRRALREVSAGDPEIEICIAEAPSRSQDAAPAAAAAPAHRPPSRPEHSPLTRPHPFGESDVVLNPQYTFDNFVPGPSNNFAYAAALAVADSPGKSYNPLFLHGSVGLGKTHLLQAICHSLMDRRPDMRILYLSCETFTNHFVTAVANGELDSFRYRYRHVDVLLIDDIHFLANRERTQEEFFHTFNTLYNANKQIILSSDSNPAEIPTLEERLVSRFKWGIVARIDLPVYETRVAIISRKVAMHGVVFPDEVVHLLAENLRNNIRELEGAVNKVAGMAHIYQHTVDMDMAREALRDIVPPATHRVSVDNIIRMVADHYGVPVRDLMGKRRTKSIAYPRQICMFLARRLTSHSLEEIGGYFGGRDHTTVMYAYDKIRRQVQEDRDLSQILEQLTTRLKSG